MIYSLKKTVELITLDNGQSVIFDSESGNTHVLDDIGSEILTYCNGKNTISDISEILAKEYDSAHNIIENDIITFLEDLNAKNVLDSQVD